MPLFFFFFLQTPSFNGIKRRYPQRFLAPGFRLKFKVLDIYSKHICRLRIESDPVFTYTVMKMTFSGQTMTDLKFHKNSWFSNKLQFSQRLRNTTVSRRQQLLCNICAQHWFLMLSIYRREVTNSNSGSDITTMLTFIFSSS